MKELRVIFDIITIETYIAMINEYEGIVASNHRDLVLFSFATKEVRRIPNKGSSLM